MINEYKFIEEKRGEILDNLIKLIRAKTINPPGDTSEGILVISQILENYGVDFQILEPVKGKQNLIAEIGSSKKSLILNGHVDVVPVSANWRIDPFEGRIIGDKLFGRGSSDMKSGVISLLYAFLAFLDNPPGRLILSIVADEETGGENGARYLIENNYINGDACIVAEPTGKLKNRRYSMVGGEKGILWIKVSAKGRSGHGSLPMLGENAIRKIARMIANLPEVVESDKRIPEDALDLINNGKEWLRDIGSNVEKVMDSYTINVGVIRGGEKANIVPSHCETQIDIRIPLGSSISDALTMIKKRMKGEDFIIEVINETEPNYTPSNNDVVKALSNSARRVLGYDPPYICMAATSDARFFRFNGIPTVNFGPGYLEVAHSDEEFVYIDDVFDFIAIYIDFIKNYFK